MVAEVADPSDNAGTKLIPLNYELLDKDTEEELVIQF